MWEMVLVSVFVNELTVKNCTVYKTECLGRSQWQIAVSTDKCEVISTKVVLMPHL